MPQKILSYLVLFNSTPLQILYPLSLAVPRQVEVGLSWGLFSLAGKALSTGVFCPKKEVACTLKWDLKKAFWFCKREAVLTFCDLFLHKSQEKTFLYSTFNFWVQNAIFAGTIFVVNRCLYELAFASSNDQIDSRTFCGLCLVLVTFGNFFRIFCFWKGLILLC